MVISDSQEDPLIAALPPNTDYITYLTILEYQLTPNNLSTLNALLRADDGTLASEIGWDLLRLVLPILHVNPSETRKCIDIIARRGNPREVIVQVAEELSRLGQGESNESQADGDLDDEDGLPTFAGEAPRVHLGEMKLQGMPEVSTTNREGEQPIERESVNDNTEHDELLFQALVSMLPALHTRIKTKHPSRFLATSLPAALGAYRRLSMNPGSTMAFLEVLSRLGSKDRPLLPPRTPTIDVISTTQPDTGKVVMTPDTEAETTKSDDLALVQNEAELISKLLQATLLEILDESVSAAGNDEEETHLMLTSHLRLKYEPESMPSTRRAKIQSYASALELARPIQQKFADAATTLKLDINRAIQEALNPIADGSEEEEHEYPTSTSQIPLSKLGLLLLCAIQTTSPSTFPSTSIPKITILELVAEVFSAPNPPQSLFATDMVLSLLYTILLTATTSASSEITESVLIRTISILKDIFLFTSSSDLRDNAHHIATHVFHSLLTRQQKTTLLMSLLSPSTLVHNPIQPTLKAVCITWLKDGIAPSQTISEILQHSLLDVSERGLSITDAKKLVEAGLFPDEVTQDREEFMLNVVWYIAALNLFCLLVSTGHTIGSNGAEEEVGRNGQQDEIVLGTMREKVVDMLAIMDPMLDQLQKDIVNGEDIPFTDIFALEDVVARTKDALQQAQVHRDI